MSLKRIKLPPEIQALVKKATKCPTCRRACPNTECVFGLTEAGDDIRFDVTCGGCEVSYSVLGSELEPTP